MICDNKVWGDLQNHVKSWIFENEVFDTGLYYTQYG